MVTSPKTSQQPIIYPDSDGQPMADNTKQFNWIVYIKLALELFFADVADVFVAGDLLWYPVEGQNTIRKAPDVMIVFGRPKGDRGSYQQWRENNISPQVVFEVLSPGNTLSEMIHKFKFYERYGVEEYYIYDPERLDLSGWLRSNDDLNEIVSMQSWVSPRLGVRFELGEQGLELYQPNGQKFADYVELARQFEQLTNKAKRLAAKLRELGIDPDTI